MRASRAAGSVPPVSPSNRSKTVRGLVSIGSGVVALRQQIVLVYAQVYPPPQVPTSSPDSRASSSDASCVCRPVSRATCWSIDTPAPSCEPWVRFGGTPVRKLVAPVSWMSSGPLLLSPDTTSRRSRNGSKGCRMGVLSNPVPTVAGVHCSITMPLGT